MKPLTVKLPVILLLFAPFVHGWNPQAMAADKNSDGVSNDAPKIRYYASFCENMLGTDSDPHAVHGIELASGGFAVTGKYNKGSYSGGFVVWNKKISGSYAKGTHLGISTNSVKKVTFGTRGTSGRESFANGGNMVVELDGHLYVAGYFARTNTRIDATLLKINTSSGKLVWTYRMNMGSKTSAFEAVQLTASGRGLILSGLIDAASSSCIEGFKSYGNPGCGTAALFHFSSNALKSTSPPSKPTWTKKYGGYISGKSVRTTGSSGYVMAVSDSDEQSSVIRTDANGNALWKKTYGSSFGEITDLAYMKSYVMITGHGGSSGELYGRLAKINFSNGSLLWAKSYGSAVGGKAQFKGIKSGNPNNWVYHECWSIVPALSGDAVVLGCGTGIEGCSQSACRKDPRNNWRSLVLSVSTSNGKVLWNRMDSFDDVNKSKVSASASEFVVATKDGGYLSTNDEACGVGLLRLEPPSSSGPNPPSEKSPSQSPSKPPTQNETCEDSTTFKIKLYRKSKNRKSCDELKSKHCDMWDKNTGKLVSNYCPDLCDLCDSNDRCEDDEDVRFEHLGNKYKCSQVDKEYCDEKDDKGRKVSEYCRKLCNFCDQKQWISHSVSI